jgi:hypothetical protein
MRKGVVLCAEGVGEVAKPLVVANAVRPIE